MKKILIIILGFGFLLFVGLGIYGYMISNSSKYIFSKNIERTSEKIVYITDNFIKTVVPNDKIQSGNYSLDVTSNISHFSMSSNLKSNIAVYMNKNKNSAYLSAKLLFNKNNIELNALLKDKKLYFKIEDVFDNYYYTDYDISLDTSENKVYEKKLLKYLEESIKENINENNFKHEKSTIKIGDKNIKTNKVTLVVTEKLIDVIQINFYKKIKNDKDLAKYLASLSNTKPKDFNKSIDKEIDEMSKKTSNKNVFNYTIYVNKNNTLKHELEVDNNLIVVENYTVKNKNILNCYYKEKNKTIASAHYTNNNTKMTFNGYNNTFYNKVRIKGTAETKPNYINANADITSEDINNGNIQYTFDKDSLKFKENLDTAKVEINGTVKNKKIPTIDISKAKKFEKLSEKETTKLSEKIMLLLQ